MYMLLIVILAATALSLASIFGAVADPVAAVTNSVDVVVGEQLYSRCIGCHSPDRNRTGPRHCDLLGRVSGTVPGYDYSDAMKSANILWNAETLNAFLQSPMTEVPGTTMGFAGIADADERRELIAWLSTLTEDSTQCRQ